MRLDEYPVESVTFTGLGAEGATPQAAAEALAASLNVWAAAQTGRRLLQLTTVPAPARAGVGLAAILVHTAGPELAGELGEQVAAAIEEAVQETAPRGRQHPPHRTSAAGPPFSGGGAARAGRRTRSRAVGPAAARGQTPG